MCAVCGAEAARASRASFRERTTTRNPGSGFFFFCLTLKENSLPLFRHETDLVLNLVCLFTANTLYVCFTAFCWSTSRNPVAFREPFSRGCFSGLVSPVPPPAQPSPSRILYAQHAAPVLPSKTHLRVRAPWPAPAAFTERHGSQTAPDKEPQELPGDRWPEPGGGRRHRRLRVPSQFRRDGDGVEDPESHRLQGGGSSLLQGEKIPGSDRQVPPGAAAAQGDARCRRDHGLRGQPAKPSRGQADRGAAESRGEHRDRVLRQPDRWAQRPRLTPLFVPVQRVYTRQGAAFLQELGFLLQGQVK